MSTTSPDSMPYNASEESQALAASAARLVRERYAYADLHQRLQGGTPWTRADWSAMADLGWLGAAISESNDGLGLPLSALVALARALGPAAMPEPMLSQLARGGLVLDRLAGAAGRSALGAWMAGESLLALAHAEGGTTSVQWRRDDNGYVLDGALAAVPDGDVADHLLVAASGEDMAVFLLPADSAGISREAHRAADGRGFADLHFAGVAVTAAARLEGDVAATLAAAHHLHALLLAAEMVAIAQALVPITYAYIAQREQFGRKLAEFQVLQHRLVDMHIDAVRAESALELACFKCDELGLAAAAPYVSAAKAVAGVASRRVAEAAVQLHGGIGMTDDLVIGHYLKRIVANTLLGGHTETHYEACARARGIVPSNP